jgi:hypothetical protein
VYGWTAPEAHATLAGKAVKTTWNSATKSWQVTVPDNANGLEIEFK